MRLTRRLAMGLATVVATVVISPNLKAQDQDAVQFAGNAQGCFYTGTTMCTPNAPSSMSSVSDFLSLLFTPGPVPVGCDPSSDCYSFNDTSIPLGPGYPDQAFIGGATDNFGMLSTNGVLTDYSTMSENFLLAITFTLPYVTDAGNPATFSEMVQGSITNDCPSPGPNPCGGVNINFDNSDLQTFYFDGPDGQVGAFTVAINDVSLGPDQSDLPINGTITVTSTPEPATMGLMATGLFGLIPMFRSRRRREV